jgi:hypothetical protein
MVSFSAAALYSITYVIKQIYFAEQYTTAASSACHLQKGTGIMQLV